MPLSPTAPDVCWVWRTISSTEARFTSPPTCYLQDLFTIDSARGKGVGRALIDAVCREAHAAGSSRVYWQTHETNAVAMRLYDKVAEKSGFLVYRKAV
jgi:GNAT superfamily N-acetyltransferase